MWFLLILTHIYHSLKLTSMWKEQVLGAELQFEGERFKLAAETLENFIQQIKYIKLGCLIFFVIYGATIFIYSIQWPGMNLGLFLAYFFGIHTDGV